MYQIKKFLLHLNCEWIQYIQLPKNPTYIQKRITVQDIDATLQYFKENPHYLQVKALVLLGSSSVTSRVTISVKYANGGHPKVSVLGSSTLSAQSTDQNVTSWAPSGRGNGSKYSCVVPSSI